MDERDWSQSTYKLCKRLCFLLRHAPGQRHLPIRRDGYVSALHVLAQPELKGVRWAQVLYVIRTNYKQRFGIAIQREHHLAKKSSSALLDEGGGAEGDWMNAGERPARSRKVDKSLSGCNVSPSSRLSSHFSTSSVRSYNSPSTLHVPRQAPDADFVPQSSEICAQAVRRQESGLCGVMGVPRRHTELSARHLPVRRSDPMKRFLATPGTQESSAPEDPKDSSDENVRGNFDCDRTEMSSDEDSEDAAVSGSRSGAHPAAATQQRSFGELVIKLQPIEDVWDPRLDLDIDDQHPHSRADDAGGKLTLSQIWIRAHQGHSIQEVDAKLSCVVVRDPKLQIPICIHGTTYAAWSVIQEQGLSRMKRSHIHFARGLPPNISFLRSNAGPLSPRRRNQFPVSSSSGGTAVSHSPPRVISGLRQNSEVALYIDAEKCFNDGIEFYVACNGVILSPGDVNGVIVPRYFTKLLDLTTGKITWLN